MNRLLKIQAKFLKYPKGRLLFSKVAARMAPYFKTINPYIEELRHNYCKVSMKKKKSVENHLKTVHAIAMCNMCEFTAGMSMEASIPSHRRWIPQGMEVKYLKKAKTDLVAISDLGDPDWDTIGNLVCHVSVRDKNNVEVVVADIDMKVSDKPKKS